MFLDTVTQNLWLFIGLATVLWFVADYFRGKSKNTPPGPWGLPILGVAPFIGNRPEKAFTKWAKTYGDVMGIKVGSSYTIVLSSFDAIQEAYVKNGAFFNDRPSNFIFADAMKGTGIGASRYTPTYAAKRNFFHSALAKQGFGEETYETFFKDEIDSLIKGFGDGEVELTTAVKENFKYAVGNVIFKVVTGKRYESYQDPEFRDLMEGGNGYFSNGAAVFAAALVFPWFTSLPVIGHKARILKQGLNRVCEITAKQVKDHEKTLGENADGARDLIDEYLLEMKKNSQNGLYTKDFLVYAIRDLFIGTMENTPSSMVFASLLLANRPHIMKKMHYEIDSVIGINGDVSYSLRERLPYCEAVLKEILRHRILVPTLAPHEAAEDIKFRGYHIPKGATVIANVYAVMKDPDLWDQPEEFIPERHLDKDGKVSVSKYFIPFGAGPRMCIGRRLAEMETFIFFIKLFQRYEAVPIPTADCQRPHVNDDIVFTGLVALPEKHTKVKLIPRSD